MAQNPSNTNTKGALGGALMFSDRGSHASKCIEFGSALTKMLVTKVGTTTMHQVVAFVVTPKAQPRQPG